MKKNFKLYIAAWAVLVAIFHIIAFVVPSPDKFSASFWIGYSFIMLTFVGQLVCAGYALHSKTKEQLFLHLPLITISYTTLIISIICGILCMVIPHIPYWVGILACALILGLAAIAVIKAKAAANLISERDNKVHTKTFFMKSLTADAESLIAKASGKEAKSAAKKVYEAVRYSDSMTSDALTSIESQITLKFHEFTSAIVEERDYESIVKEILILLDDRNKKCKLLK